MIQYDGLYCGLPVWIEPLRECLLQREAGGFFCPYRLERGWGGGGGNFIAVLTSRKVITYISK
jgi:hypothetical protein